MRFGKRLLSLALISLFVGNVSAQISGTNVFLQGAYVEIGEQSNGAFGAGPTTPPGYHPHGSSYLAEVYDWGHDGWTAGTPPFMGDYTYPGSPFEGWEIQIGSGRTQAFQGPVYTAGGTGTGLTTGSITSYTNAGGSIRSIFTGTATISGLQISQETRVDTFASAVVVTTTMRNPTATPVTGVYYMRSCDPDNDQSWSGSGCSGCGFSTNNTIVHQNEDLTHKVMVKAVGNGYAESKDYLALATKDCRARAGIYNSWPLYSATDISTLWDGTYSGGYFTLGNTQAGDIAIALIYNIGTIPAGDSAVISYAYIFNGDMGIDSAFPDPQIVINGVPHTSYAPPIINNDSFDVCQYPGLTDLPVDILNATDKNWSLSQWTWEPATGLASTTGVHQIINTVALPAVITYTITGSDSATGMSSCNKKIFYLTVLTCNGATVNSPCEGDTLKFNAPGDSTAATYQWFGPYPSTTIFGVTQRVDKYPAALSDTGTYTVIKYVGGVPVDTATTYANIHPLPNPVITPNQVNCAPIVGYLTLTETPDSLGDLYAWSGPNGYTATNRLDTLFGFDSTYAGTYKVVVTSSFGCKDSTSIDIFPGVIAEFDTTKFPGCPNDTVIFMNLTSDANAYLWNFGDGTTSTDRNPPPHIYSAPHVIHTISMTASNAHCSTTKTHTVDVRHDVTALFSLTDTICNGSALNITDLSGSTEYGVGVPTLFSQSWSYGDGGTDATNGAPAIAHTYASEGIYQIKLVVTDNLQCMDSTTKNVYVLQPYIHSISPDTLFCLTSPLPLYNTEYTLPTALNNVDDYGYTYSWSPSDNLSDPTAHVPFFSAVGTYTYVLTATLNHFGCVAMDTVTLNSVLPAQLYNVTAGTTIAFGSSVNLNADSELNYTWTPNDGSLDNPNVNNPVATPTVTTTYTVYGMDYYGCRDTATVTIVVDSTQTEFNPTAFTPNGDGLNDVFRLVGAKYQRLVEMRVFNRWGECVFSTNDKAKGWDGTYKGVPQDMGTYNYSVIVARPGYGDDIVYKGSVTLIR